MPTLIQECLDIFRYKAAAKNIELFSYVDPSFPHRIKTDHNRLKQILINLISNSVKYTEFGHVRVNALTKDKSVVIEVKDTGVGI
jgi:signal transduction histidine kinase